MHVVMGVGTGWGMEASRGRVWGCRRKLELFGVRRLKDAE